jgi:hypothetical protein
VAEPILAGVFSDTYSIQLDDVFSDLDLALGTYRSAVSTVIPEFTHAAWKAKKAELRKAQPGITRRRFI